MKAIKKTVRTSWHNLLNKNNILYQTSFEQDSALDEMERLRIQIYEHKMEGEKIVKKLNELAVNEGFKDYEEMERAWKEEAKNLGITLDKFLETDDEELYGNEEG